MGIGKGLLVILLLPLLNSSVHAARQAQCEQFQEARTSCNSAIAALIGNSSHDLRAKKQQACEHYHRLKATAPCATHSPIKRPQPQGISRPSQSHAAIDRAASREPHPTIRTPTPGKPESVSIPQVYLWLLIGVIGIWLKRSRFVKGYLGELLLRVFTRFTLPNKTYRRLNNLTLPTEDGSTQIDHVFISPYGIFVVETKNMKGWIFGREHEAQWTQKLYKRSYRFQNPLRQNYKHLKTIEALLDVPSDTLHSVICFVGSSQFKTAMPANVTHGLGSVRYIKRYTTQVLSESQVAIALKTLEDSRFNATWKTHREHVAHLKDIHRGDRRA